jgi:hypothetical protein
LAARIENARLKPIEGNNQRSSKINRKEIYIADNLASRLEG